MRRPRCVLWGGWRDDDYQVGGKLDREVQAARMWLGSRGIVLSPSREGRGGLVLHDYRERGRVRSFIANGVYR